MDYPKLLFIADCYKYTHAAMYPDDIQEAYSVLYCRKPRLDLSTLNGHIVAFGMRQSIAKLQRIYKEFIEYPREKLEKALEFIYTDFMKLSKKQDSYKFLINKWLNLPHKIPITFKILPEGTFIKGNTPIMTIHCKESEYCWLVNFIETYLNSELWKTCFIATKAALFKRIEYDCLGYYLDDSYNFHDFSARGTNGIEDSYNSSMGHLLFFSGTDSVMAVKNICDNYGFDVGHIGSIPASEHAVMCLGGETNEIGTFKKIMETFPQSMVSIVADTWNLWNIIEALRKDKEVFNMIQSRKFPIVLRPDSGDPFLILTGDSKSEIPQAKKGVIKLVDEYFGFDKVKIIYGDAITVERARKIYEWCSKQGYKATDFLCLGIGSYAYNSGIRDDVGLVTKMTWANIGGKSSHLLKNPITGNDKTSLSGRVALTKNRQVLQLLDSETEDDILEYDLKLKTLSEIREYSKQEFLRAIGDKNK
ncbi:nicotinamide phosphoribosyltransferase [Helicobacter muridarum]|uniref:Nicotinamide phosphoribosyltransferase n=1 Tax=Helicobacter muridarum TaxID=216 RepID=A0A099TZ29_9HELI|nr:nicotinamide phosphoribosyltransferase domain-containing protein [Helicobacter muridarum]TLD98340.1 nicotinamide phosphoribosyltransferase [Helicobacter muridarum]STQ86494.1 putative nicotinate phosphoribosyltransferase [Helicobacter muridarum]